MTYMPKRHYTFGSRSKIDHKYLKLLKIPLLNTEHDIIHVPRKSIIGKLKPLEIEDF